MGTTDEIVGCGTQPTGETATVTTGAEHPDALSSETAPTVRAIPSARVRNKQLERGSRIDRYLVLEPLGQGGMGIVYAAYDPKLDRKIALKLVRPGDKDDVSAARRRERLLREAQALAQLTHPNVISAYDAGTFGNDVFVAMELVQGKSLKAWVREKSRSAAEIVDVMVAAGRGLAAAHKAGLVHRDIKPSNILVGDDGLVRVVDFGLARPCSHETTSEGTPTDPDCTGESPDDAVLRSGEHLLSSPITLAGALIGTPGYIAPEQYQGADFDELSDQFSFCVTLYELLYGKRPFTGRTRDDVRDKVVAGDIGPPPRNAKVSGRLRRIVLRGLSMNPADRFATLEALLGELSRDRKGLVLKAVAVAVILALGGTALALATTRKPASAEACTFQRDPFAGVWDEAARGAIASAFHATGRPHERETFRRASVLVDQRIDDWKRMRVDACLATHERKEQSERLLDLRMACLERRREQLNATLDIFRLRADDDVVDSALQSLYALPGLGRCADSSALLATVAPPDTDEQRRHVTEVKRSLDIVVALQSAGKYDDAKPLARQALERARRIGYGPVIAEAMHRLGWLQARSGDFEQGEATLTDAARIAATAKDDRRTAEISVALLHVVGNQKRKYERALAQADLVDAMVARVGAPAELQAELLASRGFLYARTGRGHEAVAMLERALILAEEAHGPNHPRVANVLNQLGFTSLEANDFEAARRYITRSLSIWETSLGPRHPKIAIALNNLGQVYSELGELREAQKNFERALELYSESLGNDHPKVAIALTNLAITLADLGKCDEAAPHFRRAIAIWSAKLPRDHPYLGHGNTGLGRCLVDLGKPTEAVRVLEIAYAIRSAKGSPVSRAKTGFLLARALWASRGDRTRARTLASEARAAYADDPQAKQELASVDQWLRELRR